VDFAMRDRAWGCAVGAAVGDALGMPLEFGPRQPAGQLVREMRAGRLPAGTFTDDTEMALALADSLLASRGIHRGSRRLDPDDLAGRFVAWLRAGPDDIGGHTRAVLSWVRQAQRDQSWREAAMAVQAAHPTSAGNGSVMRCWPVALAHWQDLDLLIADSCLQSEVTHMHPECVAASAFVNAAMYWLLRGISPPDAVARALERVEMPAEMREIIVAAARRERHELANSGWVRHTVESAVWGLLCMPSLEEAVSQVANLGGDADTAASVVGALAGAAYGLEAVPRHWRDAVQGEWPLQSRTRWDSARLTALADALVED
jgi:ADP-ribosyl-[dinitrogen reductase] hydrolase